MRLKIFLIITLLLPLSLFSQNDSLERVFEENALKVDTLNLRVRDVIITGNNTTKPEIIEREMTLKKGSRFTLKKYSDDLLSIYNLALFTRVDIVPVPVTEKEIMLNVDVQERWYIIPLPSGGIEDGEWKKIWVGMNLRWDNFRGRNESLNFGFRIFYNPSVSLRYSIPWIGKKARLFMNIGGSWQRSRNQSLEAIGRQSGTNTIEYRDANYENIQYKAELTIGRNFGKRFAVFTEYKFHHLRVSEYQPNRTLSTDGVDRYLSIGGGVSFDTRDLIEYATRGNYFRTSYQRYGFIDKEINFGRFSIENQSFIPINITSKYYITIASKISSSIAMGPIIPVYNHEYLGYSDDYIRGWKGKAYEGENIFTAYNEIRIPILKPRYIKGRDMMIVKDLPIIKNLDLRHGLYFTLIYDIGTVWYKEDNIFKKRFLSGAGIGLNFIAPFGYVLRADWTARLDKPVVGQIGFSLSAKF